MINGRTTFTPTGGCSGASSGFPWDFRPGNLDAGAFFGYSIFGELGFTALTYEPPLNECGIVIVDTNILATLSAPNLTAIDATNSFDGSLEVISNASLVSISFPKLDIVPTLDIESNSALSSIDLTLLGTLFANLTFSNNDSIVSLNLGNLISVGGNIDIADNNSLTTINLSRFNPANGSNDIYSGNALLAASVNAILHRYILQSGYVSGSIDLSGGTNAAPTGQGIVDAAALTTRGVSVTTN